MTGYILHNEEKVNERLRCLEAVVEYLETIPTALSINEIVQTISDQERVPPNLISEAIQLGLDKKVLTFSDKLELPLENHWMQQNSQASL